MRRSLASGLFTAALVMVPVVACGGGVYCQGGPKYGTQCYSPAEVQGADPTRPPATPAQLLEPPRSAPRDAGRDPFLQPLDAGR